MVSLEYPNEWEFPLNASTEEINKFLAANFSPNKPPSSEKEKPPVKKKRKKKRAKPIIIEKEVQAPPIVKEIIVEKEIERPIPAINGEMVEQLVGSAALNSRSVKRQSELMTSLLAKISDLKPTVVEIGKDTKEVTGFKIKRNNRGLMESLEIIR